MEIKLGDVVARNSYNYDILFIVSKIISNSNNTKIAILKGLLIRIEADAPLIDLQIIDKKSINKKLEEFNKIFNKRIKASNKRINKIRYGKILHLDGDKRYSEKSARYYSKIGLEAVVRNIPESMQSKNVVTLLNKYQPDILIITGHDAMLKTGSNYNNIYNYRNSGYFVNTVVNARKVEKDVNKLIIFAGACQSYFEAIMSAGANFASSPGRILIDFIDPIIIAEKVAITENYKFITTKEILKEIKEGEKGIGGIGAMGKKKILT